MRTKLEARLKELKEEYQKGQEQLAALNRETTDLGNTMLRISGAIQVIGELLENHDDPTNSKSLTDGVKVPEKSKTTE